MSDMKAAIVTGASQGIGAGAVEAFLKRGYSVVANSRNITNAKLFPGSADLALVDGDIADPHTATKIADTAISRFGRIDVLVNNAGIYYSKAFTDYTIDDLRSLVSVNIEGTDLLVALGRTPNTQGIGLEQASVELNEQGYIKVNERLETTAPNVSDGQTHPARFSA